MNELRINPRYDPAELKFLAGEPPTEYSHWAIDVAGNELFFKVTNPYNAPANAPTRTRKLILLPFDGRFFKGGDGHLEFSIETGREIGQAILDLCKEKDGE